MFKKEFCQLCITTKTPDVKFETFYKSAVPGVYVKTTERLHLKTHLLLFRWQYPWWCRRYIQRTRWEHMLSDVEAGRCVFRSLSSRTWISRAVLCQVWTCAFSRSLLIRHIRTCWGALPRGGLVQSLADALVTWLPDGGVANALVDALVRLRRPLMKVQGTGNYCLTDRQW